MASKRTLKKSFVTLVCEIYDEIYLLKQLSAEEKATELDALLDDLLVFTDDTIRRIQNPDGKDNPKIIKAYYGQLRQYIRDREDEFNTRLNSLI